MNPSLIDGELLTGSLLRWKPLSSLLVYTHSIISLQIKPCFVVSWSVTVLRKASKQCQNEIQGNQIQFQFQTTNMDNCCFPRNATYMDILLLTHAQCKVMASPENHDLLQLLRYLPSAQTFSWFSPSLLLTGSTDLKVSLLCPTGFLMFCLKTSGRHCPEQESYVL